MRRAIKLRLRRAIKFAIKAVACALALAYVALGCEREPPCSPHADQVEVIREVLGDRAADDYEARCPG